MFFHHYRSDSFFLNSIYLLTSNVLSSIIGFIFWIFAAILYSQEQVGIATVLISSLSLIIIFSRVGLDQTIIRFFPEGDKSKIFSSCLVSTTAIALIIGVPYLYFFTHFSPELSGIQDNVALISLILVSISIFSTTTTVFIALRHSKLSLVQNIVFGSRLLFVLPLVPLGALGIISSFGIAYLSAIFISFIFLFKNNIRISKPKLSFIKESYKYSIGNYISNILGAVPGQVIPILILLIAGSANSAIYYMAYSFASIVYIVPTMTSTQLFVELSHGESLKSTILKCVKVSYAIIIPIIISSFFLGKYALSVIGSEYSEAGSDLLFLLVLSSIFITIQQIYMSYKRYEKDSISLIRLGFVNFILIFIITPIFITYLGVAGVGWSWLLSFGITTIPILFKYRVSIKRAIIEGRSQ